MHAQVQGQGRGDAVRGRSTATLFHTTYASNSQTFWLATEAGSIAHPGGQSWQIGLDNGLCLPVSRAAIPAMRKAGYASTA